VGKHQHDVMINYVDEQTARMNFDEMIKLKLREQNIDENDLEQYRVIRKNRMLRESMAMQHERLKFMMGGYMFQSQDERMT
jgi:hypothetical protein